MHHFNFTSFTSTTQIYSLNLKIILCLKCYSFWRESEINMGFVLNVNRILWEGYFWVHEFYTLGQCFFFFITSIVQCDTFFCLWFDGDWANYIILSTKSVVVICGSIVKTMIFFSNHTLVSFSVKFCFVRQKIQQNAFFKTDFFSAFIEKFVIIMFTRLFL